MTTGFLPFMRRADPKAVLSGLTTHWLPAPNVDWKRAGLRAQTCSSPPAGLRATSRIHSIRLRVYETFSGQFVFGNAYSGVTKEEVQDVADRFCADLMKAFTGHGDFFLLRSPS